MKMTGGGNDFVVVDDRDGAFPDDDRSAVVARLCRRRIGVGADAAVLLRDDAEADIRMVYVNADGSDAPMCGNGAMCLARCARLLGAVEGSRLTIATGSGVLHAEVPDPERPEVTLDLPPPRDLELDVPDLAGESYGRVGFLDTSTPHLVALLEDVEALEVHDVASEGARFRRDPRWDPPGTNVNFVAALDRHAVRMRTFEKGVEDETLSCGTGSAASAILTWMWGLTDPPIEIRTTGGTPLVVDFTRPALRAALPDDPRLTGHARIVYRGTFEEI